MPNDLVKILMRGGCKKAMCTTCGGYLRAQRDLDVFLASHDLASILHATTRHEVRKLPFGGDELIDLLIRLVDLAVRAEVLQAWAKGPVRVPAFAQRLLLRESVELEQVEELRDAVLGTLVPLVAEGARYGPAPDRSSQVDHVRVCDHIGRRFGSLVRKALRHRRDDPSIFDPSARSRGGGPG